MMREVLERNLFKLFQDASQQAIRRVAFGLAAIAVIGFCIGVFGSKIASQTDPMLSVFLVNLGWLLILAPLMILLLVAAAILFALYLAD